MAGQGEGQSKGSLRTHQALADAAGVSRSGPLLAMVPVRVTFCAAQGWGRRMAIMGIFLGPILPSSPRSSHAPTSV